MIKSGMSTRTITMGGVFVAASLVLTRFFGFMLFAGTVRISLGGVPLSMAGAILGPVAGTIVGAVADLVGAILFPQGAFFPGFTLSSALQGLIPGLIIYKAYQDKSTTKMAITIRVIIAMVISTVLISMILNTLWISILFGKGFLALLPGRLLTSILIGVISAIILDVLLRVLKDKI